MTASAVGVNTMAENNATEKINDIIATSLEKIRTIADAETIIGTPIPTAGGTTIIPVSKVSVGFASGGLDYGNKTPDKSKNFGGGGGTGISVTPVAFLVVSATGGVELLTVAAPGGDTLDKVAGLVDKAPDIMERMKLVFAKKKPEDTPTEDKADEKNTQE